MLPLFTDIAYASLAILIAVLAFYFTLRLLGKVAKFFVSVIIIIAVIVVLCRIFSDQSIVNVATGFFSRFA